MYGASKKAFRLAKIAILLLLPVGICYCTFCVEPGQILPRQFIKPHPSAGCSALPYSNPNVFVTFMVIVHGKYNQQNETLCNILYYCQYCTCCRRFLRPSSGVQNYTHNLLAATASVGEFQLTHASGSNKQA
jgi:hypothetical protein